MSTTVKSTDQIIISELLVQVQEHIDMCLDNMKILSKNNKFVQFKGFSNALDNMLSISMHLNSAETLEKIDKSKLKNYILWDLSKADHEETIQFIIDLM